MNKLGESWVNLNEQLVQMQQKYKLLKLYEKELVAQVLHQENPEW